MKVPSFAPPLFNGTPRGCGRLCAFDVKVVVEDGAGEGRKPPAAGGEEAMA